MLIMQETWTREGPHQVMCLCLMVLSCHGGDLICKIVHHCLPLRQSTLQLAKACKEAIWLAHLVKDLGMTFEMPTLHYDSPSVIMLAKNPMFHAKTQHIDVKYHFIRDMLEDKLMKLVKVHTDDNPANLMTKVLPLERFAHSHALMGVG